MKHFSLSRILPVMVGLFLLAGCADLSVENENNPDRDRALSRPDDVQGLVAGAWQTWGYASMAMQPSAALHVMADWYAGTPANFGMNLLGTEPRPEYPNSPTQTADMRSVVEFPWADFYSSLSGANLALRAINDGLIIRTEGETQGVKAAAHLIQGIAMGSVGLLFDKGFIVDETTDLSNLEAITFQPYGDVIEAAVGMIDKAIAASQTATGDFPDDMIPAYDDMTWAEFRQLANSYAARFLTYSARTGAENAATDWARVRQYASQGIQEDFMPVSDNSWWQWQVNRYAMLGNWIRVDQRVINRLDPNQPARYPTDNSTLPAATSPDKRLTSDMTYQAQLACNPTRGLYKCSHYVYTRYNYHNWNGPAAGPLPYMLKAENDLILAEATLRSGGAGAAAATLINNSRVGRGELAPLTGGEGTAALLNAISYEFDIEVASTGILSIPYFNGRRYEMLQAGTMRQLPVPASELQVLGEPLYTFGGGSGKSNAWMARMQAAMARPAGLK